MEEIAPGPDDPQPLTEEEEKEKATLLEDGFKDWTRRDFNAFVRACEKVSVPCGQTCTACHALCWRRPCSGDCR